jgi:cytochrome-b5 reductase
MRYRKGMSKRLGMVGGGTGITPLYQLIRAICEDKTDDTEISLLYGNRSESDILMRKQLDRFAHQSNGKFKVHSMLNQAPEGWTGGTGFVTKDVLAERMPARDPETKILLCGLPGMVNATLKSLVSLGFPEPGRVSKMSDEVFLF